MKCEHFSILSLALTVLGSAYDVKEDGIEHRSVELKLFFFWFYKSGFVPGSTLKKKNHGLNRLETDYVRLCTNLRMMTGKKY